ncbi:MAG: hypothetical protein AB7F32_04255 [Victivallaceae bacterium]
MALTGQTERLSFHPGVGCRFAVEWPAGLFDLPTEKLCIAQKENFSVADCSARRCGFGKPDAAGDGFGNRIKFADRIAKEDKYPLAILEKDTRPLVEHNVSQMIPDLIDDFKPDRVKKEKFVAISHSKNQAIVKLLSVIAKN